MAGRSVTLPAQINRLATAYPAINQMVFMLGGADKIVATSQGAANQPLCVTLYPRLKDIPTPFDAGPPSPNGISVSGTTVDGDPRRAGRNCPGGAP
jgi:ABC-type Fe3+-hydroxamate transport system substrate-binding protein